ncbi:MAG: calcium-binding protein, partial [Cyanothece sp. SIO1E1]|nr:calcium-binding protein [Cyanothece sp. SIO1E1]
IAFFQVLVHEAYWLQGAGQVQLVDNTAASSITGLTHFAENANLVGKDGIDIVVGNLRLRNQDGSLTETAIYKAFRAQGYTDDDRIPVGSISPKQIEGFEASNVATGALFWDVMRDEDGRSGFDDQSDIGIGIDHNVSGVISDLTIWGADRQGIVLRSSNQLTFENALVVGDPESPTLYQAGGARGGSGLAVTVTPGAIATSFPGLREEGFGGIDDGLGAYAAREIALDSLSEFDEVKASGRTHFHDYRTRFSELSSQDGDILSISRGIVSGTEGDDQFDLRGLVLRDVDFISTGDGDDIVYGQVTAKSVLTGDDGNDLLVGGRERDLLRGGSGADRIFGGAGHDIISGGSGADFMSGGAGNDVFTTHFGTQWYSVFDGGSGFDALLSKLYWEGLSQFSARASSIEWIGQTGREGLSVHPIRGDDQANVLDFRGALSGGGVQQIMGDAGDDSIFGLNSPDDISGDEGNDLLSGQSGNDVLSGGVGNDILYGGSGDDNLRGEQGLDILRGGTGNDTISLDRGDIVEYGLGDGHDMVGGKDLMVLRIEASAIPQGGIAGTRTEAGFRVDLIDGSITFSNRNSLDDVTIEVVDVLSNAPEEIAAPSEDEIPFYFLREWNDGLGRQPHGSSYATKTESGTKYGTEGHEHFKQAWEVVYAGDGNDAAVIGEGSKIYGGNGHDNFGTAANFVLSTDQIDGGSGIDKLSIRRGTQLENFSRAETSIEIIQDNILGTEGNNVFDLRGVNLMVHSLGALDWDISQTPFIAGNGGDDIIYGNRNANKIEAGDGSDRIYGMAGDDQIDGGAGNDVIRGGLGRDQIRTGGGQDVIEIEAASGTTIVEDFRQGEDLLRIDTAIATQVEDLTIREISEKSIGRGTYIELANGSEIYLKNITDITSSDIEFSALETLAAPDYEEDADEAFIFNLMASKNDLAGQPEYGANPDVVNLPPLTPSGNDETPTDESPVDDTPIDESPIDESPIDESPTDDTPVDETPVDQTPVDGAPTDETPINETPTNETDDNIDNPGDRPADDMSNPPAEDSLSDGNDVFNGDKTSQIIRGLGGNDRITAKAGDDKVYGGAGSDTLWGNHGNDTLKGGQGHDTLGGGSGDDILIGVDASQMAAGRGEIDLLVGHKGADRFVIGDSTQTFYNDGVEGNMGLQDYAAIRGFNRAAGDVIQLHGQAEDYTLGSTPKGTGKGTGIFLNTADKAELVAVVRNGAGLDLESEDFQFV